MNGKSIARGVAAFAVRASLLVLVVVAIYKLTCFAYDYGYRIFAEPPMTEGEGITVTVSYMEDDSVSDLGQKLYDQGLIRDTRLFYFQEMFSNYHGILQPGVYELNTSMTVEEMLGVMSLGMGEVVIPDDEMAEPVETLEEENTEDYEPNPDEMGDESSDE